MSWPTQLPGAHGSYPKGRTALCFAVAGILALNCAPAQAQGINSPGGFLLFLVLGAAGMAMVAGLFALYAHFMVGRKAGLITFGTIFLGVPLVLFGLTAYQDHKQAKFDRAARALLAQYCMQPRDTYLAPAPGPGLIDVDSGMDEVVRSAAWQAAHTPPDSTRASATAGPRYRLVRGAGPSLPEEAQRLRLDVLAYELRDAQTRALIATRLHYTTSTGPERQDCGTLMPEQDTTREFLLKAMDPARRDAPAHKP